MTAQQVFHPSTPTAGAPGTPAQQFLYGPPALYYLGEMQCRVHNFRFRRIRRRVLSAWNLLDRFAFAGLAGSCSGECPGSPAGRV